jgi:hypothetical protein
VESEEDLPPLEGAPPGRVLDIFQELCLMTGQPLPEDGLVRAFCFRG